MRSAFLALLARAPAHGYELKQAFDETFGGVWPPINVGQIYTTLGRLERDGLVRSVHVEQAHRPDKKVYELTDAGRAALEEWIDAPAEGPRLRDDFFLKVVLAQQGRAQQQPRSGRADRSPATALPAGVAGSSSDRGAGRCERESDGRAAGGGGDAAPSGRSEMARSL